MAVEFLDPRPPVRDAPVRAAGVRRSMPTAGGPRVIGLLANGFPDSVAFLDHLATELDALDPHIEWRRVAKARPPDPLGEDQLAALTACHAVIAAYGH